MKLFWATYKIGGLSMEKNFRETVSCDSDTGEAFDLWLDNIEEDFAVPFCLLNCGVIC